MAPRSRKATGIAPVVEREANPLGGVPWSLVLGFGTLAVSFWATWMSWKAHRDAEKAKQEAGERKLEPGDSVLLIGDSIGVGLSPYLEDLLGDYGSTMKSKVEVGTTFRTWSARTTDDDGGYDVVLVSLGSNDAAGCYWCEEEGRAMDDLLGKLRSRGAQVFWVTPPSFRREGLRKNQEELVAMLEERGLLPLEVKGPQQDVSQDPQHLHLTPNGYRAYAAQLFDALTR